MSENEIKYVQEAFASNWIAPLGPYVDRFEKEIANYLGGGNCAALNSGTSAIHLALILSGVEAGDHVICPTFTFSATANPILYQKAIPVFVDSEMETWNMDPVLLRKAIEFCINKNKKPKAIIIVHLYGMPCKLKELLEIAEEYEIPVIEDAAESLGSKYNNRYTGTFSKFGVLSFNGNKIITTSGGGALFSEDKNAIEKARFLATQSRDKALHYQHSEIGYNYRLSNICAAIGCGQMEMRTRIQQRRKNFELYSELLSDTPGIEFLQELENTFSNRWLTTITVDPAFTGTNNLTIISALENENIECRPLWKPLHLQPVFSSFPSFNNGNSEALFNSGLCLPSGSSLHPDDLSEICETIKECIKA
ncbi:MAG: aminotransferase class I/II-fold pyridoxal phosphate-dependent enzyme [Bacteroidetes bacterium]|nr:aminotransferase class I/II-fold pyridoxal phosphate-dependent enzyme [Bacteroidota bacterium]